MNVIEREDYLTEAVKNYATYADRPPAIQLSDEQFESFLKMKEQFEQDRNK
jgi:hypothetical protein